MYCMMIKLANLRIPVGMGVQVLNYFLPIAENIKIYTITDIWQHDLRKKIRICRSDVELVRAHKSHVTLANNF